MLETLKTLCSLPGASGREDAVREYLIRRVNPNEIGRASCRERV